MVLRRQLSLALPLSNDQLLRLVVQLKTDLFPPGLLKQKRLSAAWQSWLVSQL
jgi:hypothetical protein